METSNYEKFQTGNPVARRLIDGFYRKVEAQLDGRARYTVAGGARQTRLGGCGYRFIA